MKEILRPAVSLFVLFSVITGLLYPAAVTLVAQALFPAQANGSLVLRDGKPIGSLLIGQNFSDPKYFWGRPSATSPQPYNAAASSGSNLGPLNPALIDAVKGRVEALRTADVALPSAVAVPQDLVTASASGLDPDISPAAAAFQVARIARSRGLAPERVSALVVRHTEARQWGVLGEPRVNVLELNLALDELH
jgi:K+-transporting ATPase ATPase C chain